MGKYIIPNAGGASYAEAWNGSTIFTSTTPNQPHSWTRKINTSYNPSTGELSWTHTHLTTTTSSSNETITPTTTTYQDTTAYFAYFPPYSYERHLNLIAKCDASSSAMVTSLGQTID